MNLPKLILASTSPRRRELLTLAGLHFSVIPADVNEDVLYGETPDRYVLRLAESKAWAVLRMLDHEVNPTLVIAADTTVADRFEILGKPANPDSARTMLRQLRGRPHQVYTGVAVVDPVRRRMESGICRTVVQMRSYSDAEIQNYIDSGDPFDKAGAYAIQNTAFNPVESITGCYTNVMGLPLCLVAELIRGFGTSLTLRTPLHCPAGEVNCEICTEIQHSQPA